MSDANTECFGGCPTCHSYDGFANVGREHWMFCKEHRVKWCVGANLFSSWQNQTEEEQRRYYNEIGLGEFKEVKSWHDPEIIERARKQMREFEEAYAMKREEDRVPF